MNSGLGLGTFSSIPMNSASPTHEFKPKEQHLNNVTHYYAVYIPDQPALNLPAEGYVYADLADEDEGVQRIFTTTDLGEARDFLWKIRGKYPSTTYRLHKISTITYLLVEE